MKNTCAARRRCSGGLEERNWRWTNWSSKQELMKKVSPSEFWGMIRQGEEEHLRTPPVVALRAFFAYLRATGADTEGKDPFEFVQEFLEDLSTAQAAYITAEAEGVDPRLPRVGDRHYVVEGRIPYDDDDTMSYVHVPEGSDRDAWQIFVEDRLYEGKVISLEEWKPPTVGTDYPDGIPEDWRDRAPRSNESNAECWAVHVDDMELFFPPSGYES